MRYYIEGEYTFRFKILEEKDEDLQMVAITKEEKDAIRERFPDVSIVRTMRQKSKRHHYYCEETKSVRWLLKQMREAGCVTNSNRKDVRDADRKTGNRVRV